MPPDHEEGKGLSRSIGRRRERGYRPIGDYALIGDAHTAALVATDGSIDWLCWPHFDDPAVFCRLLDAQRGGWFRVGPVGEHAVSRTYAGDTNVLTTTFRSSGGAVRLTDLMPARQRGTDASGEDLEPSCQVLRLVEGLAGEMEIEVEFRPTFDYDRTETALAVRHDGAVAHANGATLILDCPVELESGASDALHGRLRVAADDRFWVTLSYRSESAPAEPALRGPAPDVMLEETLAYWRRWSAGCSYAGPYHELVRRSALTLKLLTFAPTGALVAAPTTSLPEEIGGARNWDYRYAWLRDASLILSAFEGIGYHREATDFFGWLGEVCLRGGHDLKIMYRIDGSPELPERTLDHLEGYRRSRPVRIGNAAAGQRQLDVYGEVLDAASLHVEYLGQPDADIWGVLWRLADQAAARWREPDQGIWEVRGGARHFLYSKLLCWVALDRAIRLAERAGLADGRPTRWRRTRGRSVARSSPEAMTPSWGRSRRRWASRRSMPVPSRCRCWASCRPRTRASVRPSSASRSGSPATGSSTATWLTTGYQVARRRSRCAASGWWTTWHRLPAWTKHRRCSSASQGMRTTSGCWPRRLTRRAAICWGTIRRASPTSR